MHNAYTACKLNHMPVKRAARIFGVPVTSLRDRVLGKVDHDTAIHGKAPLFSKEEEQKLCEHFKIMASLGYGYSRSECVQIASDFAVQLGKRQKDQPLSMKWIRKFLKRWPEMRVLKPRGLEFVRAKMASEETVTSYFQNLSQTIEQYNLGDKPHLIFNVDEKGITINHKPPCVVASGTYCPSAVTSGRGKTVTILGGGSAGGVAIPPFFIFPGKRMNQDLMDGKSPGAHGTVSETGWSNSAIFKEYLTDHFLKYIPGRNGQKVLLLLDGHRSHVAVGLAEWARDHDIVLFILPAHTSHILQPLDVACYGPFERMYNAECHKLIRQTEATITKYNICQVACRVYLKALSPENLQSGFKRTGISPLSKEAIPKEYLVTAEIYREPCDSDDSDATVEGGVHVGDLNEGRDSNDIKGLVDDCLKSREVKLRKTKGQISKKPRNTISKVVSGKEMSECVIEEMKQHEIAQKKHTQTKSKESDKESESLKKKCEKKQKANKHTQAKSKESGKKSEGSTNKCEMKQKSKHRSIEPKPGPSCINLSPESDLSSDYESESDDAKCCVCGKFTPDEVAKSDGLIFVKWVQCDAVINGHPCMHWVHLIFCTPTRVVRKGVQFLCPHCKQEE